VESPVWSQAKLSEYARHRATDSALEGGGDARDRRASPFSFATTTIRLSIAAQEPVDLLGEIRDVTPLLGRAILERARDSSKTLYEWVRHGSLRFSGAVPRSALRSPEKYMAAEAGNGALLFPRIPSFMEAREVPLHDSP
jgi:hypothetical protein